MLYKVSSFRLSEISDTYSFWKIRGYTYSIGVSSLGTTNTFRTVGQSSLPEIITLGCFLIATMASLRFRDLLRTKLESLSIQGHILRGISWRTKTSVSGQPWGVCCLGITTRPSVKHWVFRSDRNWQKSWLLGSPMAIPFSSPCSYHHALALIRFYPNVVG